jgi:hypothetical protein
MDRNGGRHLLLTALKNRRQVMSEHLWSALTAAVVRGMGGQWLDIAVVLTFAASSAAFLACLSLPLLRGRFSLRVVLFATAAACLAVALLAGNYAPLPD